MSLNITNVSAFKVAFTHLKFDPNSQRRIRIPAGGFVWADEVPDFDVIGVFPVSITAFLDAMLSYRVTLMMGNPHERFTPIWTKFKSQCSSWPGFHPERNDPGLLPQLEMILETKLMELNQLLDQCKQEKESRAGNPSGTHSS